MPDDNKKIFSPLVTTQKPGRNLIRKHLFKSMPGFLLSPKCGMREKPTQTKNTPITQSQEDLEDIFIGRLIEILITQAENNAETTPGKEVVIESSSSKNRMNSNLVLR